MINRGWLVIATMLLAGCATFGPRTSGTDGSIEWQAVDLKLDRKDQHSPWIYSFNLELRDTQGRTPIFLEMERQLYQPGAGSWSGTARGSWKIPAGGVLSIPMWSMIRCMGLGEGCQGGTVPIPLWRIVMTGIDDGGRDIRVVIDLRLPPDPSPAR